MKSSNNRGIQSKPSVTVGVPAHNEEANILHLLESIVGQQKDTFVLERIIVICDGCTDKTVARVRMLAARYHNIVVVEEPQRKGKIARLNQLYSMNASDILITIDADTILAEPDVIEKVVSVFNDPFVAIAAIHQEPVAVQSFIGKICRTSDLLWLESRVNVNGGDHIHNLLGSATAMRKDVAHKLRYPASINSDSGYVYVQAKKFGKFTYIRDAKILYRAPETLADFWSLSSRAIFHRYKTLAKSLGNDVLDLYKIPARHKIFGITKMFIRSPFYTVLAVLLNVAVRIFPRTDKAVKSKTWEMVASVRQSIVVS